MEDGRVWFTEYRYSGVYDKPSLAEKCQFHIPREAAGAILNAVIDTLCHGYEPIFICDIGSWDLTLTNTEGQQFQTNGPLCPIDEADFEGLSSLIRKTLNRNDLFLFDGNADFKS